MNTKGLVMKIRRHYFMLRRSYPHITDGVSLDVTTSELAETLDCTHRNMVLLLKRMVQEGWIEWSPKRGRGNRSTLTFLAPVEKLILDEAKELVLRGDLQPALTMIQQHPSGHGLQEQFQEWLTSQFGFHTEVEGNRRMDMLRFPLPGTINSLDPARIHYFGESHLVNQMFDSLVRMDERGETTLPHLAHAWEVNDDRTEWTFYLRKGVLFHHGRQMVASDVMYSLERLRRLAPNGLYSWVYNDIVSMVTPDDTTIRIKLKERNEIFLSFLSTNRASIVPQDVAVSEGERFGEAGGSPVGTGPFRLISSEQGIWTLEAFPSYFQGRAFLDRVEIWTMPITVDRADEPISELQKFQVMHNVRISDMAGGAWQQVRQSGTTCKFLTVNELKEGPLTNPDIRAALDKAISRTKLLRLLSGDVIEAASSFWLHGKSGDKHVESLGADHSEERSEVINSEDCNVEGLTLTLTTIPQYASDASMIKQLLAEQGINLDINLLAAEQFKGSARMSSDLLLFAVMLDEHRELRLIDLYKSMQQHLPKHLGDELESTLGRILSEKDARNRVKLFIGIEQQLVQRISLLFLYRKHLKTAFHPSVQGISLESLGWVRFRDLWFR
ncbi:SgrR family transcriptional regulator [Paenibacillus sp. GSMTC-2017]|uniref:ABC transporter substrate-binding protein n=1 Tax=Paenibacillus sp. GSMTC-2017 TaxID=2794350 RepID=UPI0018D8337D|nr:ABC transporter substrate-binding protein [Paenibacillus sp. GSMTC-2017]MBH5319939.1 SgrR family transcriptional regulator [Paenibacillus sp. GSMTC-2017]